ncbi:MAG: mycofactocin precursor MftA [Actinomycetota bacterium]|jgi:mycofactocin precursor|nr:mycofactocin precursor MftA [Actinomycetota bacterium]MDA8293192.1 mycofactocin precursor MftA [Actinomycetota bacterium]
MTDPATNPATDDREPDGTAGAADATLVETDLIVEDVSIDGMCGVY